MGIVDDDIARVREATDLAALIGEQVGLKRVGRRLVGLCPFHSERTPSFSVNPELGLFHCFGCQTSGDAITFVRETEHLDFVEAVERLARRAGIELRYDDRGRGGARRERKARLVEAIEAAVEWYHRRLMGAEDAGPARKYLRSRGFDGEAARRFSLGWAPDGWDDLARTLQQERFSRDDLVEAGLAFVNRANRLQDQFRGRLLFPIFDPAGDPVAFGGRAIDPELQPKYKNSPDNALYHKSRVLYGLNWAKGEIVAAGEVVVCEGYTDVMACHLAGVPTAVATCGTALTEDHVRVLKRFASRVVLAYDADAAGQAAAERFYEWEAAYDLEVAVADLGAGGDPADVWRDDPALLVKAIEGARPFLGFRIDRLLERADTSTAEGRARTANGVIELLAEHPDPLVRDQYVVGVADRLEIDVERMRATVERVRHRSRSTSRPVADSDHDEPPEPPPAVGEELVDVDRRDVETVRLAVHRPDLVPDWLASVHFASPTAREAFGALASATTFQQALGHATPPARALLERVAVEELPVEEAADDYATDVVVYLVEAAVRRRLRTMSREGDERSIEGKQLLEELGNARTEDDRGATKRFAEQLVTWLDDGVKGSEVGRSHPPA